ncbi:DsrE family protein [Desulfogranum mediterraneum]|uniref:DsrE family protein n=1 Tax=Desulfogranum mediterraneum TaxID=160661 RepID=UPI00041B57A3|nr:DsrE family protein [Desulfogranum mediterraneum]
MIYKAVFHLDINDEQSFNIGLTNISNLLRAIPGKPYDLMILCNGPAVHLVMEENCLSQAELIKELLQAEVKIQVCGNALERYKITKESLVSGCEIVPLGIATLIQVQNQGYAYVKP